MYLLLLSERILHTCDSFGTYLTRRNIYFIKIYHGNIILEQIYTRGHTLIYITIHHTPHFDIVIENTKFH